MTSYLRRFCFSTLILSIISCQSDSEKYDHHEMKIIGALSIPMSFPYSQVTMCMRFEDDRLFYLADGRNEILQIDLLTKRIVDTLQFAFEGPNGMGKIVGFDLRSNNTLYITSRNRKVIFVGNFGGKLLERLEYGLQINRTISPFYLISSRNRTIIKDSGDLVIDNYLWSYGKDLNQFDLKEHPIFIRLDEETSELKPTSIRMPEDFLVGGQFWPEFSYVTDEDNNITYVTFSQNNTMYMIDWVTEFIDKKKITSMYFESFSNQSIMEKIGSPMDYGMQVFMNTNLLIDPYRKVLYRIIRHNQMETLPKDKIYTFEDRRYYNNFSIQVLNLDLDVLGEYMIDTKQKYVMDNMFVGLEGLYISRNNPYHSDYDENSLDFDIFRFE